ncbi:uncharacterized protein LOC100836793 isoform X2 [Brachypodium distachyon]|uniref:DUF7792 domain-containing protein n=1 Tax=Brachypodium distachyon TaxID=15368 RepID=I1IJJ3_BRADI|nr:uncharacterized protein LOC100836793 isoform X2 [Brachypodium distachyon]KQJ87365.1 hypothetical protein BRADI_4g10570v3 [Brachypodium distachyon]|eukprot:XP_003575713.1 uncharacterized protein LOC100836793 isoform X2 [Brachypodium distachyon]
MVDLAVFGVGGGVLRLIFTLAVAIGAKADTAKQNREECLRIARRAAKLHGTLAAQAYTLAEATRRHPAVASVLNDLREALREALEGVKACQRDCGALIRLLKAARVSAQLRVLNRDIKDRIMDVLLVTSLYTNGLVYTMHLYHMEHLRIQRHIMMHGHHMEHHRLPRPLPQMQIQLEHGYGNTHAQSLSNQSYAIQAASPSLPDQRATSSSIPCQIEWRAAVPEDVVDFRREARESNIEPRLVVLLILVLLLLGTRCGLERLLLFYLWRLLFRLG